jgi:predicted phage-related endonuclease
MHKEGGITTKHIKYDYNKGITRSQWLEKRNRYQGIGHPHFAVGGSDIGLMIVDDKGRSCDEYKTRREFFYQMIGRIPRSQQLNLHTIRGIVSEQVIYDKYFKHINPANPSNEEYINNFSEGKVIRRARSVNAIVTNTKYPFMFANIDFKIDKHTYNFGYGDGEFPYYKFSGKNGLLECKAPTKYAVEKYVGQIAPSYIFQTQSYLMVCELAYAEVLALVDNTTPNLVPFEPNKILQEMILNGVQEFADRVLPVKRLIFAGAPEEEIESAITCYEPDVEATGAMTQYLKDNYNPENFKPSVDGSVADLELVIKYLEQKEKINEFEPELKLYENMLRDLFSKKEASEISFGELGNISYKTKFNVPARILKKYKEYNS